MVNATRKTSSQLSLNLNLELVEPLMPLSTIMNTNMGEYALSGSKTIWQTFVIQNVVTVAGLGLLATILASSPKMLPAAACQSKELHKAIPMVLMYALLRIWVYAKAVVVIAVIGASHQMTLRCGIQPKVCVAVSRKITRSRSLTNAKIFTVVYVALTVTLAAGLGLRATLLNSSLKMQTVVAQLMTSKKSNLVGNARK